MYVIDKQFVSRIFQIRSLADRPIYYLLYMFYMVNHKTWFLISARSIY